jgi:hypothetical protein
LKRDEIFAAWAPGDSPWSPWVKPVLFAHMDPTVHADPMPALGATHDWIRPEKLEPVPAAGTDRPAGPYRTADEGAAAIVVDLPAEASVLAGLSLADRGFRPVPLYNAVPRPDASFVDWRRAEASAISVVDVMPIVRLLASGAYLLHERKLPSVAPPAFLLDANRDTGSERALPGRFDNRSVSFTTDFPSASRLLELGICRVLVAQLEEGSPHIDLAATLCAWQAGGLRVYFQAPNGDPELHIVRAASWWRRMMYAMRRSSLKHHPLGGYGAFVPERAAG